MDKHSRTHYFLERFLLPATLMFVLGISSCITVSNTFSLLDSVPDEQVVEQPEPPIEHNLRVDLPLPTIHELFADYISEPEEPEPVAEVAEEPEPLTEREQIELWVEEISADNGFDDAIIKAIVYHESRFQADAFSQSQGQSYYGLMQINPRWQKARMAELGVTDLQDPYSNLLVGIDYISDLTDSTGDTGYALMLYSMNNAAAKALYKQGKLNSYAKIILSTADIYRSGGDPSGTT